MAFNIENKDKRIGLLVSFSVHAIIILLFFFIMAWSAPDPPLPEYGIELNFGLEQEGSGYEQPTTTPTPPTLEEVGEPEPQVVEEQEQVIEEQQETPPVENTEVEELPDSQQEDSPVETQPSEESAIVEPVEEKVEEVKPVSKPAEETPIEEPKVEEKVIDSNALYPGSSSQGKKDNEAGDAGDPEGTVDSRALLGKRGGGGGGPSLELAGWKWDNEPNVIDNSKENGFIVFRIKVDAKGEVFGIDVENTTVSPSVVRIYSSEVQKLTFSQLSRNTVPASVNVGKITFIIRSK